MAETAQQLIDMIQTRYNNRSKVLTTISDVTMENVPDEVKTMREIEAAKIRAVMSEQMDLIEVIKILFPNLKSNEKPGRQNRKNQAG